MAQREILTDARRDHFGAFYDSATTARDGALLLVHGNCQAESLRVLLQGADVRAVRIPPVHELEADDLPHLSRLLASCRHLVSQPVRDDYRGLPVGTAQVVAALPPGAGVVIVPVVRAAGLYPVHALVRPRSDPSLVPPIAPYHDLRTLLAAGRPDRSTSHNREPDVEQVLAVAAASQAELRRREATYGTVPVSDLLDRPRFDLARTLNHPGNALLAVLAERVRRRLGLSAEVHDPQRPLLDGIHAPRLPAVIEAFGLDDAPTDAWAIDGAPVPDSEVRAAHLRWYGEHPDVVVEGLERHATTLAHLGLR